MRDRTSRLLVRIADGRELRLREFGTKQRAWVKVLRADEVEADDALSSLGPEAWPDPPPLRELLAAQGARPLHAVLRDQHVVAGIGRSWVDEILWTAELSPFKRADDLDDEEAEAVRAACIERPKAPRSRHQALQCQARDARELPGVEKRRELLGVEKRRVPPAAAPRPSRRGQIRKSAFEKRCRAALSRTPFLHCGAVSTGRGA